MKITKLFTFVITIIFIPIYCWTFGRYFKAEIINHINTLAVLLYAVLFILCIKEKYIAKCTTKNIIHAIVVFFITLFNVVPINYMSIVVSITTTIVFFTCKALLKQKEIMINWFARGANVNFNLLCTIIVGYAAIYLIKYSNEPFKFSLIFIPMAIAPAISEELIFRVFLPLIVNKYYNLDETLTDRLWSFLIINIPFVQLHCVGYFINGDMMGAVNSGLSVMANTIVATFLIRKYGIIYGIFQHALLDFMCFCVFGI